MKLLIGEQSLPVDGLRSVSIDRAGGVVLLVYDDGSAWPLFGVDADAAATAFLRLSNDVPISVR